MTVHAKLPARFDHVGSFLRPQYLLEAREQKAKGIITPQRCAWWKTEPLPKSCNFKNPWA
jgi:hypothetical protein